MSVTICLSVHLPKAPFTRGHFKWVRVRVPLDRGYVGGPLEVPGVGGSEEFKGVSAGYNIVEDGFWGRGSG